MTRASRAVAAAGAGIGAFGLVLEFITLFQGMSHDGAAPLAVVWRYFAYFTILTNVFVTLVMARAAFAPERRSGLNAPRVELMAVTSILFVCIVYNLLLASRWDPQGWQKVADLIVHQAVPVLFALFWWLRPHGLLIWRDALFSAWWPAAYAGYGLSRGAVDGYYPYFFMDPSQAPWTSVLLNMTGLVIAFVLGALALIGTSRALKRSPADLDAVRN